MGVGGAISAAKSSNEMMKKQIADQQAQLKQKRESLFSDELETLKSSGQAHLDTSSDTNQGAF